MADFWKRKRHKKPPRTEQERVRARARVPLAFFLAVPVALILWLLKIDIIDVEKDDLIGRANNYHFGNMTIKASRGTIYDANDTVLAWSAQVYNIYIDPQLFREQMQAIVDDNADKQAAAEESGTEATDLVDVDALQNEIADFLSEKLDLTKDEVTAAFQEDSRYHMLQRQVEKDIADEVTAYFDDQGFSFIGTETASKRYYPQDQLAAAVIGFTNADGDGQYGLEYQYDDILSGIDGRTISAQAADGSEMPYRYSTTYDAQDGASLHLTLDVNMQYYLEKALGEMVREYEVQDRACGIIMNPKTGAIYAMATYPSFDLNNPSEIYDVDTAGELAKLPQSQYEEAYVEAREKQWRNKAISEINPPGSTFKIVTTSSAFEEDLIDLENDTFYCSGSLTVLDATISCSRKSGHGLQTFSQALVNSCNPAFMEIGMRLGIDKFSYYFQSFGLSEKTGIDLPNELSGTYIAEDDMSLVDLASSAFGQTNELTALQLITAYSAAINGGNLMTPYLVESVVDANGNVIEQNTGNVRRQVISAETSESLREQLKNVVESNPSHNAYIQGYSIGGKSGTAEIRVTTTIENDYVSSYCCFAPAEDPEVIMLIQADYPNPEIGYYGSTVVVPYAREVMEEILPYMGYYPEYDESEYADMSVSVPLLQDMTIENAQTALSDLDLTYEVVGEGTTVLD